MTLFFLNPDRSYYLRELVRRFGYSVGSLARELKAFSKEGLFERAERGKEVFYRLHHRHPLFTEIRGIVEKTVGIPKRLSDGLQSLKEIQEAYLYGSFVKGKMKVDSDIDLILVGDETQRLKSLLKQLEAKFDRSISSVLFSPEEFQSKKDVKGDFLYAVIRSPLIQIKPLKEKEWI